MHPNGVTCSKAGGITRSSFADGEMVFMDNPNEFAPVSESAYCGAGNVHTILVHTSPITKVSRHAVSHSVVRRRSCSHVCGPSELQ